MLRWGVCVVLLLLSGVLYVKTSKAIDTKPVVRAKSRDAKFIGTSMEGALVIVRDSKKEWIYELTAYSYDPETGNTGVDRKTFKVSI